jgi:hypothetical protein
MVALARFTVLAFFAAFFAGSSRADITVGSTRNEVITELGRPSSAARRGSHEVLIYPKGVRIELEADAVVDIKGYVPTGVSPAKATPAAPAAVPSSPPVVAPAKLNAPPPAITTPPTTSKPSESAHKAAAKIEFEADAEPPEPTLGIAIGVVAVMLFAQFLLTFTALKIAFHYHQMDALWSGILAITGIDVALQTLFAVLLFFHNGEVRLGVAGTGLPGLAMIWSIRHFCLDQRWKRAFATASAVKIAAILLNLGLLGLLAKFGY